jgi:hypothetical protein
MCIKDYETEIGGQGPVRAAEILERGRGGKKTLKILQHFGKVLFTFIYN